MAIYSLHINVITRSKGQSAVASASYRSGEKLHDERTDETKFYKREVQPDTMILAPNNAPSWVTDREKLWNEVERVEKRKDSQLARDLTIVLPRELSNDQQRELVRDYIQNEFVNKGMVADISIHRDDKENPHAHVMLTMRTIDEDGFGKKNRDWNADFANRENNKGFVKSGENALEIREQWSNYANQALEKAGFNERITHLSHEDRGLETKPTIHLGHVAHAMEKNNEKSDRGNINREIHEYNKNVIDLQKYREEKERLQKEIAEKKQQKSFLSPSEKVDMQEASKIVKGYVTLEKIEERREQLAKWEKSISKSESYYDWKEKAFDQARGHINKQDNIQLQIKANQKELENINWLNPFKIKENNQSKERCDTAIKRLNGEYNLHEEKLNFYREKLKFTTNEDFYKQARKFVDEKNEKMDSHYKAQQTIEKQSDILDRAEKAIKQSQIREVTSHYPELKNTSEFMTYENAMKLKEINDKIGKTVPIEKIQEGIDIRTEEIQQCKKELDHAQKLEQKYSTADSYFKQLDKVEKKIDRIEKNPFLKGKALFHKESKNELDQLKNSRDQYKTALKGLGFEDRENWQSKKEKFEELKKEHLPKLEKRMHEAEHGNGNSFPLGLLEGAMQGIEQAKEREERERRKTERQRYRGQKEKDRTLDLGR